jgi:hypothetical protein
MQRNVTTTYYRDGMAGTSDDVECILPEMPADLVIAALRSNAPIRDIAKAAGLAGASLKRAEPRLQADGCPRVADSNSAVRAIAAARAMHLAVQNTEGISKIHEEIHEIGQLATDLYAARTARALELNSVNRDIRAVQNSPDRPTRSLSKLLARHDRLVADLRATYTQYLNICARQLALCRELTQLTDTALYAAGHHVAGIHSAGGTPRDRSTIYRRTSGVPRGSPDDFPAEFANVRQHLLQSLTPDEDAVRYLQREIKADLEILSRAPGQTSLEVQTPAPQTLTES